VRAQFQKNLSFSLHWNLQHSLTCMMSSRRVFSITEVTLNICQWLDDDDHARLARTSKLFMYPALSLLWDMLASLLPLIKLLPENCWKIDDNSSTLVSLVPYYVMKVRVAYSGTEFYAYNHSRGLRETFFLCSIPQVRRSGI